MKYVFGPVNSRRLGVSLGIDIVPLKVCSFNCIYCECGPTTELTDEVKEYLPYDEIVSEISQVLSKRPKIDVVTFSGSGEPTLNSRLGDLIRYVKTHFPEYKVAVLTNSSLLYMADVRASLLQADIIYPSLDAVSEKVFNKIMRPLPGINSERIIDSITLLRNEFKGSLCLEIFIIAGVNDTADELSKLKEACIKIRPDEIHLNSLDRPGAEEWVKPMDFENLERIKNYFYPLPVKVVGKVQVAHRPADYYNELESSILHAVRGTGLTAEELADFLNMRLFDVLRALKNLQKKGQVKKDSSGNREIYTRIIQDNI
ncbi:MAG TPA: radical SAM protein [Spirochaetota bacterium]|nr:radical SAM protein [Spirochaetota bacterium]HPS87420.1 radical SAM protein [Spirochaetota bacterium]